MSLVTTTKVGKKFTIYIPRKIVENLKINEGDRVKMSVEKGKLVIEVVKNPLNLALSGEKFARISEEQIEQISLEEQRKHESPF